MMGLANTSVMVAFWAAATNLRLLDAFERDQAPRTRSKDTLRVVSLRQPRRNRALSLAVQAAAANAPPGT